MSVSLFLIIWAVELIGLLLMNNIPRKLREMGGATVANVSWLVFVNVINTAFSALITYAIIQTIAYFLVHHLI